MKNYSTQRLLIGGKTGPKKSLPEIGRSSQAGRVTKAEVITPEQGRNMFRYRLRTLLIVLALAPPVLAGLFWAGPTVVAIVLAFVAFVACLAAIGVLCAMGLASIADAFIEPWEKRRP